MKVGISMIYKRVDESTPNPGVFALECEKLGLESVWVGDHMLFHAEPKTPFPAGGSIPDHYAHFPEPFVVLAMAAATTKNLCLGTSVLLVPEHEPLRKELENFRDAVLGRPFFFHPVASQRNRRSLPGPAGEDRRSRAGLLRAP